MVLQRLQVNEFGTSLVTASGVLLGHAKDKRHGKDERPTSPCFPYSFAGVCPVSMGAWLPEHRRWSASWCMWYHEAWGKTVGKL